MRYRVAGGGPYELFEEGDRLTTVGTADDVLFVLYQRCHARLVDHLSLGRWLAVHGAVATVAARRVLIVGDKGAGKTTLMLRLLYNGNPVEGDELVFIRDGVALPMPRRFHIKPGTRQLIPELDGRLDALPATFTDDGTRITAFDPTTAGFRWRIDAGPIDAAVVLGPRGDGPAVCRPVTSVEFVRTLVHHAFPRSDSRAALLGACASLVASVDAFELVAADLASSVEALASALR